MLPALDNFVTYGAPTLIQNQNYLQALVGMVSDIFRDINVSAVDKVCGCRLAETLMLNLRGHLDQYLPTFVSLPMTVLEDPGVVKTQSFRLHLMEMVINAIYYNPLLTLHILEANNWTNTFFSSWFSSIDLFTRVHDKKLAIIAITSLLTLNAEQIPASVQLGWPRLMQGVTALFQTLPAAIQCKFFDSALGHH